MYDHRRRTPAQVAAAIAVAAALSVSTPRKASAQDHVDFKAMYYQEDGGRISVTAPAFYFVKDFSPTFGIRIDGVYNAISGASPTGAPLVEETYLVTNQVVIPVVYPPSPPPPRQDDDDEDDEDEHEEEDDGKIAVFRARGGFHAFGAATPRPPPPPNPPINTTMITQTVTIVRTGKFYMPVATLTDKRTGLNMEVVKKVDRHALSAKVSYSTESDYDSYGAALSDSIEFNDKNTTLLLGGDYMHDIVKLFAPDSEEIKRSVNGIVGVSQLLDKQTRVTLNGTLGRVDGYQTDPYKVAELNGDIVGEKRPDRRNKRIAFLSLARYFMALHGSAELGYRYYTDSFGIDGHTGEIAWFQELGEHFILRPQARFYRQNDADFYAVRFSGSPEFYSSDYRLSALQAVSYGAKLIWKPGKTLWLEGGYDRYDQKGLNNDTPQESFPSADIITGGLRWTF